MTRGRIKTAVEAIYASCITTRRINPNSTVGIKINRLVGQSFLHNNHPNWQAVSLPEKIYQQ
jgi:hypothetical protein